MPGWRSTARCTKRRWVGKKTGPNPTDRGKGGVKRSVLNEARGLPVGLVLDGANWHDVKLVESTLASMPPAAEAARQAHRAGGDEQGLCLDAGYDSKQVRETRAALGYTAHIRPRGEEVQAKKAGQKARKLLGDAPFCLCPNYVVPLPIWIASK